MIFAKIESKEKVEEIIISLVSAIIEAVEKMENTVVFDSLFIEYRRYQVSDFFDFIKLNQDLSNYGIFCRDRNEEDIGEFICYKKEENKYLKLKLILSKIVKFKYQENENQIIPANVIYIRKNGRKYINLISQINKEEKTYLINPDEVLLEVIDRDGFEILNMNIIETYKFILRCNKKLISDDYTYFSKAGNFKDIFTIENNEEKHIEKTAILYVFHQINPNVINFINNIFQSEEIDFYIICNSLEINLHELNIPHYVSILKRENIGYDFGGWSDLVINYNISEKYKFFVFINSSVAGPFTPIYYQKPWYKIFTDQITDDKKLIGCTINCGNVYGKELKTEQAHVQSFVFATDFIGLDILLKENIFKLDYSENFYDVITNREIGMSRVIIKHGYNIGCLMRQYKDVDFRMDNFEPLGDPMCSANLDSFNNFPHEIVFVKTNRARIQSLTHLLENY